MLHMLHMSIIIISYRLIVSYCPHSPRIHFGLFPWCCCQFLLSGFSESWVLRFRFRTSFAILCRFVVVLALPWKVGQGPRRFLEVIGSSFQLQHAMSQGKHRSSSLEQQCCGEALKLFIWRLMTFDDGWWMVNGWLMGWWWWMDDY